MKALIYSSILFLTPVFVMADVPDGSAVGLANADHHGGQVGDYIETIITFIDDVLFPLALAIAFIFLVWGIVKYFVIGGDSDDGKSKGKQLIIYALVGFVIIFSFYGIVKIIQNGLGLNDSSINSPIPKAPKTI